MVQELSIYVNYGPLIMKHSEIRSEITLPGQDHPEKIDGRILGLDLPQLIAIRFGNVNAFLGHKAHRYRFRYLDSDGNFEAELAVPSTASGERP